MNVSFIAPPEFQGPCVALINKRKGNIVNTESHEETCEIEAEVPLNCMFGTSSDLRSITQGKGEFSMVYKKHEPVYANVQADLIKEYQDARQAAASNKK
jgi:elongation factor G